MVLEPLPEGIAHEHVVLLVRRGVQVQGRRPVPEDVLVVHEHYLPVAVRVYQWQDIQVVHLDQELVHVRGGPS